MKNWIKSSLVNLSCATLLAGAAAVPVAAADFPAKPVVLVVAGPPAGATDNLARILGAEITPALGQVMLVDNRAGAGGIIGTKSVIAAAPDGHTLLLGHVATNAIVPAITRPRPYDPIRDFIPVAMVGTTPDLLIVSSKSGINSLAELLARGKTTEGLSYGSPGVGLPQHIAGFSLAKSSGVKMLHVPYRGSAPALTDLIGGQISMMFVSPGAAVPYLKSGQVKVLAITSRERSRFFPDVPTVVELGHPLVEETSWLGVFAPAGTPDAVVQSLNAHFARAIAKPATRAKLESMYLEPAQDPSARAFGAFVKTEVSKWADIVQKLGITAE